MGKSVFQADKMYTYLRGYATGAGMKETLKALTFARSRHEGQLRKSGDPYIVHPLTIACNALSLGLRDDNLIAAALLHDVVEDCGVEIEALPVNYNVRRIVGLLTFHVCDNETKEEAKKRYYNNIATNREATLIKLLDRCHNVSNMAGTFSQAKLEEYIEETETYVMPLIRKAKLAYPEDSDVLFVLKYHITSVVDSISATMQMLEKGKEENNG